MASGFKTRISYNSNPFGKVTATTDKENTFKVFYAGAWYPHGPEARDMAIDVIHEAFPGAAVEWERTARVARPQMKILMNGRDLHCFDQNDMSDDLYGPGVDELRQLLLVQKK